MKLPAINFHVWKPCNYKCRFCFATFREVPGRLTRDQAIAVVETIAPHCDKLTFVGGEPTLCPFLGELLDCAHRHGLTTCVVSNGERLHQLLETHAPSIDWVGLSVDSADEDVNVRLGRGTGGHVCRSLALAAELHHRGIALKLNTVVTQLTYQEDLRELVRTMRPERWKVFQVLPIAGQNDGSVEDLLINKEQFAAFLERHASLAAEGLGPVKEDNDDMTGSYVMIDPLGRFFDNVDGRLHYGPSILEVGLDQALEGLRWERDRFLDRGGLYPWRRAQRGR